MSRTLVMGDIHGAYRALTQVAERANFNPDEDTLIFLGDVADGWPDTYECIEWLIDNKALCIMGNHDHWTNKWFSTGIALPHWLDQGGQATVDSYANHGIPDSHLKYMRETHTYIVADIDGTSCVFTHGGFDSRVDIHRQPRETFMWDRELWYEAVQREAGWQLRHDEENPQKLSEFDKIFIGHTYVGYSRIKSGVITKDTVTDNSPRRMCNVYNIDTGAGWDGVLTIYCVETDEYWQSDNVKELYPDVKGRF